MEAAGIVDEVGSGVPDRLKFGDAVMASWCRKATMARIRVLTEGKRAVGVARANCAGFPIGRALPYRKDPF